MRKSQDAKRSFRQIQYLIPRSGTVCRVSLYGRNELRAFRTELALLQRVANAALFHAPTLPVEHLKTLTAEAYLELDQILHDALHPLIETTIARIDRDFTDLRKDVDMSAVDEEAKKIVAEATAAGINMTGAPDEDGSSDVVDARSVSEAFDLVEAGLAATVAADCSVPAEGATPPGSASSAPQTPAEDAVEPGEPEQTDTAAIEPTGMEESVADASSEPVEAPGTSGSDVPSAQASSTPQDTASGAESESPEPPTPVEDTVVPGKPEETDTAASEPVEAQEPCGNDDLSVQASPTPQDTMTGMEHVENAVAVIEQGIRKLAAMLKGELQEQWTRAHKTFDEVDCIRIKLDEERNATQDMLEGIARLRDEARIARDETDLVCRDAKQLREAARVAMERAETSAAVAELAADQAGREAKANQDAEPQKGGE